MNRFRIPYLIVLGVCLGILGCDRSNQPIPATAASAARDFDTAAPGASSEMGGGCQTAFAYGSGASTCFADITGTPRWGWSIGPIVEGSHSYDIYAGAGRCDLAKGSKVAVATVEYADGTAKVEVRMLAGYVMGESHLYLGAEPLPRAKGGAYTVAPDLHP